MSCQDSQSKPCWTCCLIGRGTPFLSSILLEDRLFVAQATTVFCMTKYVVISSVGISDRFEHMQAAVRKEAHTSFAHYYN